MPAKTIQQDSTTNKYYKLNKKLTYKKTWNGKEFEETSPCFTEWDKEAKEEVYFTNLFGGRLSSIILEDPKTYTKKSDGTSFSIQNLVLEFKTVENRKLMNEKLSFFWLDKFSKVVVSKLLRVKDFSNINILAGRMETVVDGQMKINDFVTLYEGDNNKENKLEHVIFQEYPVRKGEKKREYPEDAIFIPKKKYLKENEDGGYGVTTDYNSAAEDNNGYKMVDKKWQKAEKQTYADAVDNIQKNILQWVENNPLTNIVEDEQEPIIKDDVPVENNPVEDNSEPNDPPEVNMENTNIKMPF